MPNGSGSIIERYEWDKRKDFGITYYYDRCLLIGADQFDSTQTG